MKPRTSQRAPRKPDVRKRAIRLLRKGIPARQVAKLVGAHRNTVNRWRQVALSGAAVPSAYEVALRAASKLAAAEVQRLIAALNATVYA